MDESEGTRVGRSVQLIGSLVTAAALVVGCASSGQVADSVPDSTSSASSSTSSATALPVETTTSTVQVTTTTAPATTTTTLSPDEVQLNEDVDAIMGLYNGWNAAIDVGTDEIESYLNAHLYPDLPDCMPGEKTLPKYTAQRDTIKRADGWKITWGPLNGEHPKGRVYEVQLTELDSPSHVAILHSVAFVFWNCKGYIATDPAPTPGIPPEDDWGEPYGSGCTPGSDTLPDGEWAGYVTSRGDTTVLFDLVCMHPTPEEPRLTNQSSKIRTVPVDAYAVVYPIGNDGYQSGHVPYGTWQSSSVSEWCSWVMIDPTLPNGCPVWLYINAGSITEIVEFWLP